MRKCLFEDTDYTIFEPLFCTGPVDNLASGITIYRKIQANLRSNLNLKKLNTIHFDNWTIKQFNNKKIN